jgi:hypothetical protein
VAGRAQQVSVAVAPVVAPVEEVAKLGQMGVLDASRREQGRDAGAAIVDRVRARAGGVGRLAQVEGPRPGRASVNELD